MRAIGHKVDAKLLRDDFDYYRDELAESAAGRSKQKRAKNAAFFIGHVRVALNVARTGYLFDMPLTEIVDVLNSGLRELVTALEVGAILSPIDMRYYLGAALVTGDKPLVKWLSDLPKVEYTDSGIKVSDAGYLLVQALQTGMKGDEKAFQARVTKFAAALSHGKLIVSPAKEKAIYGPLAALLQAVAQRDSSAFERAWQEQESSWKARFGRPSERANMEGLIDFEALGIGRIAERWEVNVPDSNPYTPVALLKAGKRL